MSSKTFPSLLLLTVVLSLLSFGLCMLFSTSSALYGTAKFSRQLMFIGIGSALGITAYFVDYRWVCRRYKWIYLITALVLGYLTLAFLLHQLGPVSLPLTKRIKGAFRWIRLGPVNLQPSEFSKIAIVICLAQYYHLKKRFIHTAWKGFWKPALLLAGILALILLEPSVSVTVLTGGVAFFIFLIAGVRLYHLFIVGLLGCFLVVSAMIISPERMSRYKSFLNPEKYAKGSGYQLYNSLKALGSGGLQGNGFAQSRMKNSYLPEAHTDFIVAIVGEELGYIGVLIVIGMYCTFFFSCILIARQAADYRGMMIATGLGISITLHAFCNLMVISGSGPTTGVTAPFISYGGSSMVAALLSVGILLNIARVSRHHHRRNALRRDEISITRFNYV